MGIYFKSTIRRFVYPYKMNRLSLNNVDRCLICLKVVQCEYFSCDGSNHDKQGVNYNGMLSKWSYHWCFGIEDRGLRRFVKTPVGFQFSKWIKLSISLKRRMLITSILLFLSLLTKE